MKKILLTFSIGLLFVFLFALIGLSGVFICLISYSLAGFIAQWICSKDQKGKSNRT